jgi:murein DD-endopeptidase MepM/ murein hydrolase activator NlpD
VQVPIIALLAFAAQAACLPAPVDAPIVEAFRPAPCTYCAGGHRGVEYDTVPGTPVRASAAGIVTFAGSVAGTRYVIVEGDDGLTLTYGMVASVLTGREKRVDAGQELATTGRRFYFGVRRGEEYLDPQLFLARPTTRPRLVPTTGAPPRPPRRGPPRCPADDAGGSSSRLAGVSADLGR